MTTPVVIVGASLAALRTAEALRRSLYTGPITIIGDEPHLPYNRPPLSKAALSSAVAHKDLAFFLKPELAGVEWVLGRRIISADLEHQSVTDNVGTVYQYTALVAATGVRPKRLALSENPLERFVLRSIGDATRLRSALIPGVRVVVAGAGFIGCEVATVARSLGCDVTVVSAGTYPMERTLGTELARELMRRHALRGISFRMSTTISESTGHPLSSVRLADGGVLPCDVLVEAIGSEWNAEWLAGSDLDAQAGVATDSSMRVLRKSGEPWPNVFAVGDLARFPNSAYAVESFSVGHWNIPTETGKRAGRLIACLINDPQRLDSLVAEEFHPIPSFWSDQFDVHLLAFGMLGLADSIVLLHGSIESQNVFGYFRGQHLVGVCGIGMRSTVCSYRTKVGRQISALVPVGDIS